MTDNSIQKLMIHTSDNLFCLNLSTILELSVKFASQICYENINKPLDGAHLGDFGIDITADASAMGHVDGSAIFVS